MVMNLPLDKVEQYYSCMSKITLHKTEEIILKTETDNQLINTKTIAKVQWRETMQTHKEGICYTANNLGKVSELVRRAIQLWLMRRIFYKE